MSPTPSPVADFARLLRAAHAGCRESLGRLLQHCRPYLLRVADKRLRSAFRSRLGASDLAQEALLRAVRAFDGFRGQSEAELLGWLRRILLNRLADEVTRQRRRPVVPLGDLEPEVDGRPLSAGLVQDEQSEAVLCALARLSAAQREVVLCRCERLTWAQVGERVGRSADAVRLMYYRAVKELARRLRLVEVPLKPLRSAEAASPLTPSSP